jgi:membrane-associated phospholipid phosphatase
MRSKAEINSKNQSFKSFSQKTFGPFQHRQSMVYLSVLALAVLSFIYFDLPIAIFFKENFLSLSFASIVKAAFTLISELGRDHYCLILWLFIYCLLPLKERFEKNKAFWMMKVYFLSLVSAYSLKFLLGRARPFLYFSEGLYGFQFLEFLNASKHSMPSGHACIIAATMTSIAYLEPRVKLLAYSLSLLVAASRIILGAHYFSDILVGWLLGHAIVKILVTNSPFFTNNKISTK